MGILGWNLHNDSSGFSECAPVFSSCVLVVADVSLFPSWVGVLGEVSLSGSDCEIVKSKLFFFLQEVSSLPYGMSMRFQCGKFAQRRTAVVKEEDTRSGLWSSSKIGSGLSSSRKKDAEVPGQQ